VKKRGGEKERKKESKEDWKERKKWQDVKLY